MHSDLFELCSTAREQISVPPFPGVSIRTSAQRTANRVARRRAFVAAIAAGLSVAALAAAAEIATQSHIGFTRSGGMLLASSAKSGSRAIDSSAEIRQAARHLNFPAVLPAGLPKGTKPIRLFTAGADVMAVTYDLPGAWRASHHFLWIFLANPATMGSQEIPAARYRLYPDGRMSHARWRAGGEEVIVVSNGLTQSELQTIKHAMQREPYASGRNL